MSSIFAFSVLRRKHKLLLRLYRDHHRHVFVREFLEFNLVPPRREQERQRMRIHTPRSLPRPRRRASVSPLVLTVQPPSGQRYTSYPRR